MQKKENTKRKLIYLKRRKLEASPPKKLLLILDIDHTFLHASRNPQAWQVMENDKFSKTVHKFFLSGKKP